MPSRQPGNTESRYKQQALKDWGSFNSSAYRQSLKENDFAWLENLIQIGPANLQSLNGPSAILATCADPVYAAFDVNLGGADYIMLFCTNGNAYTFNTANGTLTKFATGIFGTTGIKVAQWQSTTALIVGPTGYWAYNGTNLITLFGNISITSKIDNGSGAAGTILTVTASPAGFIISPGMTVTGAGVAAGTYITSYGTGNGGNGAVNSANGTYNVSVSQNVASEAMTLGQSAPTSGVDVATYAGRVWICNNRTVYFSAPGSYSDFTTTDFGGSFIMYDQTLYSTIVCLVSANNYLYIIGTSSIDILSDVRVGTSTTLYTLTNISANIGTNYDAAIVPYLRSLTFLGTRGPYVLAGAAPQKMGPNLDGILPLLNLSTISSATGQINNQNCVVWNAQYNDPLSSNRYLMMCFFDGKWFLASQSTTMGIIVGAQYNGVPRIYGIDTSNNIYRLFDSTTSVPSFKIQTALWSGGDPTLTKQIMKVGVEAVYPAVTVSVSGTADTENASNSFSLSNASFGQWLTAGSVVSTWQTATLVTSNWLVNAYVGLYTDATGFGKYYGVTLMGTVPGIQFNGILIETIDRARW